MREIRWHHAAEEEFAAIVTYVLQMFGQKVALEVYEDIISRIDLLAEFPELGTTEPRYKYKDMPMRVLHSKLTRSFIAYGKQKCLLFCYGTTEWMTRR